MISKFGYKGTAFLQYRRENHDIPFYVTTQHPYRKLLGNKA